MKKREKELINCNIENESNNIIQNLIGILLVIPIYMAIFIWCCYSNISMCSNLFLL